MADEPAKMRAGAKPREESNTSGIDLSYIFAPDDEGDSDEDQPVMYCPCGCGMVIR